MVLHGGNLPNFIARYPRWSRLVLGQADVLVTPSPYLIDAIRLQGFNARHIPNVINLENYPYTKRTFVRPRLIWMRSFHDIYHPEMAIEVVASLHSRFPDIKLFMAGQDKGLQAAVRELALKLDVGDRVEFPGFLNTTQKVRYFAEADIFINTSRIDNMPVALVEACAMGLPIVTTNVGGIPYLVTHEETALLVPSEDVQAMAEAVTRLLHDHNLVARLSENGRRLAERSAWEQIRPQWEQLFAEVLSRRK
jgi:glycosyltransferase involved in cell wall biosynthesis